MDTRIRLMRRAVPLALAVALLAIGGAVAAQEAHWSYSGDTGPTHWGSLDPAYAACAQGQQQSPVDIPADAAVRPADIAFDYRPSAMNIVNNGHTVQVNYDPGSSIRVNGVRYDLTQFHFHARSEHALAGQHEPMEIHFVHKSANGGTAVVGVRLTSGAENPAYAAVIDNLPTTEGEPATVAGARVDARRMLPAQRTYWRYGGSLTTPPCTEGVQWLVMNSPVELSARQIAAFTAIYSDNARPVQPLNGRTFSAMARMPRTGEGSLSIDEALVGVGLLALMGAVVLHALTRRRAT
jgi:carbonic anhydrase